MDIQVKDMMRYQARFVLIGALLALLGVAMGAFAAHGLKALLPAEALATIKTGVLYQLLHAVSIVIVATLMGQQAWQPVFKELKAACMCLLFGVLLFSGSLYGLVLADLKVLGPVTPIGGVLFLVGWGWLMRAAWKHQHVTDNENKVDD